MNPWLIFGLACLGTLAVIVIVGMIIQHREKMAAVRLRIADMENREVKEEE
jgi:hypothetical protein